MSQVSIAAVHSQGLVDKLGQLRDIMSIISKLDPEKLQGLIAAFQAIRTATDTKGKILALGAALKLISTMTSNTADDALAAGVDWLLQNEAVLNLVVNLVDRARGDKQFPFAESDMTTAQALGLDWSTVFSLVKIIVSIIGMFS